MEITFANLAPMEIENKSLEIITNELGDTRIPGENLAVVKRVIHTTADFEYAKNLVFTRDAVAAGRAAMQAGCAIITDTKMAAAGVSKAAAAKLGCEVHCYVSDEDVAATAKQSGSTRSRAAVDKAAALWPEGIFVVGNAPTALIRICELIDAGVLRPRLVVGVPVGFVNVVESKELMLEHGDTPSIVARGRKGGSNVAAAICNALLYGIEGARS